LGEYLQFDVIVNDINHVGVILQYLIFQMLNALFLVFIVM